MTETLVRGTDVRHRIDDTNARHLPCVHRCCVQEGRRAAQATALVGSLRDDPVVRLPIIVLTSDTGQDDLRLYMEVCDAKRADP